MRLWPGAFLDMSFNEKHLVALAEPPHVAHAQGLDSTCSTALFGH